MLWMMANPVQRRTAVGNAIELFDRFLKANAPSGSAAGEADKAAAPQDGKAEPLPRRAYAPAVDLVDSETEAILIADLPGVPEGGVEVSVEKNVLTLVAVPADGVIARKTAPDAGESAGEYRRSFTLSDEIDRDRISAALKDGVLRVRLPKQAAVTKKIAVSVN